MNEAMGLTAADVAAVTKNDGYDNGFGNGGWWIWIILIAFLFCGNGWGRNNDTATTAGENAFLSDEFVKRDIFNTNQNVSNTACQTQRDVLESRYTTQLGLQQMQAQQQACCCETQKEVLQNRYDAALMAQNMQAQLAQCCCDIKETILADGQATRQLMQDNTIQNLRDKLADRDRDLQLSNFQISQVSQTKNIVDAVRPFPTPAYITASPYVSYNGYAYGGCNCGSVNV
jgi:hypothetical protein|nr:MAG TPA: hypothetical protein [Caudoviricetes sp.]